MALIKEMTTAIGVTAAYHVFSAIHWYPLTPSAHIDISSYVSQEAFASGAQPVEVRQFEFVGGAYPFSGTEVTAAAAYGAIKTTDVFADAQET
jgi:hypothetical protein